VKRGKGKKKKKKRRDRVSCASMPPPPEEEKGKKRKGKRKVSETNGSNNEAGFLFCLKEGEKEERGKIHRCLLLLYSSF